MGEEFVLGVPANRRGRDRACRPGRGVGPRPADRRRPWWQTSADANAIRCGRKQPVERQQAQDFLPVRAFAAAAQAGREETYRVGGRARVDRPASTRPRSGAGKLELRKLHLHRRRGGQGRRAVGGKRAHTGGLAVVFIEDGNGLLPGGALGIVISPR